MVRASALFVFVAAVLFCAAPAAAQGGVEYTVDLTVTPVAKPLTPIRETTAVPFDVFVVCGLAEHDFLEQATMTFAASTDASWATVTVAPTTWEVEYHMEDCVAGVPREMNGTVMVLLSQDAVAGAPIPLHLTATLETFEEATVHWNETVAPYMRTQVEFGQTTFKVAPGGEVRIPATVTNLGNGPIRVAMTTDGRTSTEIEVTTPAPVEVPAFGSAPFEVVVMAPGTTLYTNDRHQVWAMFVATSLLDESIKDAPQHVNAVIQVQGFAGEEKDTRAPPIVPFLGALACLAFVARRRLVQQ